MDLAIFRKYRGLGTARDIRYERRLMSQAKVTAAAFIKYASQPEDL